MNFENLLQEVDNGILTITINRPKQLNAINALTMREIGQAIADAVANNDVRAIIITGAGEKAFVAGADIKEFAHFNPQQGRELAANGHRVFKTIEDCPKPVLAAINGFALGAGCELAMSCHLRVASENAKFGQPEVALGVIPGYGGTQRLIQNLGKTKAFELLMTGDMISAAEAKQLGLVNYVTEPSDLMQTCRDLMNKILKQSPMAISGIIATVNAYFANGAGGFQAEVDEFGKCFGTPQFVEGTTAFMEKRKPDFLKK